MPSETARYNWTINQGSLSERTFQLKDSDGVAINTTGLSGRGQIRTAPGGTLVCTLVVAVVNHSTGTWKMTATPAATSAYSFGVRTSNENPATCYYDIELYDPGDATDVTRWLEGKAIIYPEVTTS
jgi:hypothetical protein